jgi:hypothetical protein
MAGEVLVNPNNPPQQSNGGFWSEAVGNLSKLLDNGVQIYSAITDKSIAKKQASAQAVAVTPPSQTILGMDKATFTKYALIGAGAIVLILVLKKR